MSREPTNPREDDQFDPPRHSVVESAGARGDDDRRSSVNPADNPAPRSPQFDEEVVRSGERMLERVKPY